MNNLRLARHRRCFKLLNHTFASHEITPLTSYLGSMEKSDLSFTESSLLVSLEEIKNLISNHTGQQ